MSRSMRAGGTRRRAGEQMTTAAVRHVWTDHLPLAEVERVAPNEEIAGVEFGMEALAELAAQDGDALATALTALPAQYGTWIAVQQDRVSSFPGRRGETAARLVDGMRTAEARI